MLVLVHCIKQKSKASALATFPATHGYYPVCSIRWSTNVKHVKLTSQPNLWL
ncbi:MAG: hypothetical protein AAFR83_00650 [Cyanobacteria bacterium J06629_18]